MTTTRRVRVVECFAGAGGLSRAWELGGAEVVAHLEIDEAARSVLRAHWPGVRLLGDVAALAHGRRVRRWWREAVGRVDVVSGGSPCQDLSVAGARAGLGGARSSLFFEQVRLWRMLGAPYFLWENVAGAFSSRRGADFAVVLSALVGGAVAVPRRGWRHAGVVAGPGGVAAWRCTDLHRYGVPQRRRRLVVVAARAGGVDPAEVLALTDGVCGDPPARGEAGEDAAAGVGGIAGSGEWAVPDVAGTPGTLTGGFRTTDLDGQGAWPVLSFAWHQGGDTALGLTGEPGTTPPVRAGINGAPAVLAVDTTQVTHPENRSQPSPVCHALARGTHPPLVIASGQANALRAEGCDASEDGTGRGAPIVVARALAHGEYVADGVASTLRARDAKGGTVDVPVQDARPRRLTPRECERLMSWPDDWTRWGVDARGRRIELKDTPRYKLCGNGVATVQFTWVCERLVQMELATP